MASDEKQNTASERSVAERLKAWLVEVNPFKKQDALSKNLKKVKKLSEKELEKQKLRDKLFTHQKVASKKESYEHIRTQDLLRKAGLEIDYREFRRLVFRIAVYITLACSLGLIAYAFYLGTQWYRVGVFLLGFWTAGFLGILAFVGICTAIYLDILITRRRKEVEEVLPDFLQLTAANIGAGMPIDRALWYAVRPRFGVLAVEIETVAKRVLTGEELDDALRNFSEQYESPVLQRSVNLLLEGIAAGGHIAELPHTIAVDIQEQRILEKEMSANVMTYVIFISFAAVLAAPVLFGLSTELLVVIQSIVGTLGESSTGFLTVSGDVISQADFQIFSMTILAGSAIMSALIVGVIRKGTAKAGLHFIPPFVLTSLTLYLLAVALFHGLFGGLV